MQPRLVLISVCNSYSSESTRMQPDENHRIVILSRTHAEVLLYLPSER